MMAEDGAERRGRAAWRIQAELTKLGFLVSETTVSRYMPRLPAEPANINDYHEDRFGTEQRRAQRESCHHTTTVTHGESHRAAASGWTPSSRRVAGSGLRGQTTRAARLLNKGGSSFSNSNLTRANLLVLSTRAISRTPHAEHHLDRIGTRPLQPAARPE